MAFDVNDPAHLTALKTEVETDPLAMGYDANIGNTRNILDKLNVVANNVAVVTGPDTLTSEDLLKMVFAENISAGDQFRIQLLFEMTLGPTDDLSRFKTDISALDVGLATAIVSHVRPLSRAEVLFTGVDSNGVQDIVVISRNDWFAARDNG